MIKLVLFWMTLFFVGMFMTLFSRQKSIKSKIPNDTISWIDINCHDAKFHFDWIKSVEVIISD